MRWVSIGRSSSLETFSLALPMLMITDFIISYGGGMSGDREEAKKPIVAPAADPKREVGRAVIEAVAGIEPVTGFLTRLYQTTHPPRSARDREIWQQAITERTNDHGERLDEHDALLRPVVQTFTGLTAELIAVIVRACPDGLAEHFIDVEELLAALPGTTEDALAEAAEHLIALGLVEHRALIGAERMRPTQAFYEQFDHQVMSEWGSRGTRQDAAVIASVMLEKGEGRTPELLVLTAWPLRRFNPALAHLKNEHPAWCWRDRYHFDYPTYGLVIGPKEKAGLRRFIAVIEREVGR